MAGPAGDEPASAEDIAGEAIDHKQAGKPVDASVRTRVEPFLGVDLGEVAVHDDPAAQAATSAIGARAFAYGADVFLGPGESPGDVDLMAHELTHVAQQGAAQAKRPQGKVEIGAANSPAEAEADAVADAVTGGARPPSLLVDGDGWAGENQMPVAAFLTQLQDQVTRAASDELGPVWSAIGCPYIEQLFRSYANRSAREVEAALHVYAPATARATSIQGLIAPVLSRVRGGVQQWVRTGEIPADAQSLLPAAGAPQDASNRAAGVHASAQTKVDRLGDGTPLDSQVSAKLQDAYGHDLSSVRVHTGPTAARMASEQGARAFTVGSHIAFGAGEYSPGTPHGDALIAHEAAHVVQQRRGEGTGENVPDQAHEQDADNAATGALTRMYLGAKRVMGRLRDNAVPALTSDMALQRCPDNQPAAKPKVYSDAAVQEIAELVAAGNGSAAHERIAGFNKARAGDSDIREILGTTDKVSVAASFRGSILLEMGPESEWPPIVRNYVWGVENGVWSEGRLCPAGGHLKVIEHMIYTSESTAQAGDPRGEYRARFNSRFYMPPYRDLPATFAEVDDASLPTSKGPRSPRARKIFEDLYNDAAMDVKRRYDANDPPGYRDLCDNLVVPDGFNIMGSAGIEKLHQVFRSQARINASSTSDGAYLAFRAKVETAAGQLNATDRQLIQASNQWLGLVNDIVRGPDNDTSSQLRADLLGVVTNSYGATTLGPAPMTTTSDPEPTLDGQGRAFLAGVQMTPDKSKLKSHADAEVIKFNVESSRANPGLPIQASVSVEPQGQVRTRNPAQADWETGKRSVEVEHLLGTAGTAAKTEFEATLRLPPVRDGNFAPKVAKVEIEDDRLDWFKRSANVEVWNVGAADRGEVSMAHPAQYYGDQLVVDLYPDLPQDNPGLSVNVEGKLKPPGRAPVDFPATPFPGGRDHVLLGQAILQQPASMPRSEIIEYEVHFKDATGALLVTRNGRFKAMRGGSGSEAEDRRKMAQSHTKLRRWLRPGGALFRHMTRSGGPPHQARVARACAQGFIRAIPMITRTTSLDWLTRNGGDPDTEVAWAYDVVDDAHTFAGSPDALGFQWNDHEVTLVIEGQSPETVAEFLTHEAVHAVDIPPGGGGGDWEQYKAEFRAYWLANYQHLDSEVNPSMRGQGPKSERARAIFNHMYYSETYDYVKENYDNDIEFRNKVDNYMFPDGINLPVTKTLDDLRQAFEASTGKPFVDAKADIEAKYNACSPLDKRNISASHTWRDMVEQKFKGKTHGHPPQNQDVIIKGILNIPI